MTTTTHIGEEAETGAVGGIEFCCAPLLAAPLSEQESIDVAAQFKVLADPVRLRLLSLIAAQPAGACACDLVGPLDRSQPTVSHHLKQLTKVGLLNRERRGRWVWYSVSDENVEALSAVLESVGD